MSSALDRAVKHFQQAIQEAGSNKTKPFDTQAEVIRVEDGVAWVHMPGGIDETPVQLTVNAKKGDTVQVRVAGGKAWLVGNGSAPPTDDTKAIEADDKASSAAENANIARMAADQASEAAAQAVEDATKASEAADEAQRTAESVEGIARHAEEVAEGVEQIARDAETSAGEAKTAADTAIEGMSLVQRVVDTANWIQKHGTYVLTTDTEPTEGKFYFIYNTGTNTYSIATPREGDNPQQLGWYEMGSIDESVSNFISTHMVLLNDGLVLQNGTTRLYLDTTQQNPGVRIETNGQQVAYYGNGAIIGDENKVHIKVTNDRLSFYDGLKEVAYVDGQKLYITQTVVLQQMDIGDSDLGVWTWYVHEVAGQNNLSLKWLG